ncbi:hypothetical protein W2_gp035c [Caulobacter phage W2]|uniref:DUF6884 domain-containing protein n=1 Tax=Caulobacter phage TMCBR4 TaxID=3028191 RepID=A0AAF0CJX1_9CAUD|nr:hypothetical protein TMCBR4_gp036c [Caulobacter phage TMCBR4]WDS38403.1 hypothetical protein W2_gp035c [Caulobacter phage W2]
MAPLHLIACSSTKAATPCAAKDLYDGHLFRLAREYVEAIGAPWRILSAKHGLVHPDTFLAPYDQSLNTSTVAERNEWAHAVAGQLADEGLIGEDCPPVVFLAGVNYRTRLCELIADRATFSAPMVGLGIGEQKAWLIAAIDQHYRDNPPPGTLAHARKELRDACRKLGDAVKADPLFQAAARAVRMGA